MTLHVGMYDPVVTVGGIRFVEHQFLRNWDALTPENFRCTVFWPDRDSGGDDLPWPFEGCRKLRVRRFHSDAASRLATPFRQPRGPLRHAQGAVAGALSRMPMLRARGLLNPLDWMLARAGDLDLVYCPNPTRTLPRGAKPRFPCPLVVTLHDLAHEFTSSWGARTPQIREEVAAWCRLADMVVFSSDWVRKEAMRIYGIPKEKTAVVHLAPAILAPVATEDMIQAVVSARGIPRGYALCLGSAAPHKGHLVILEAFARLRREHGIVLPLVFAGPQTDALAPGAAPPGPHWEAVQRAVRDLGFTPGVDLFCVGLVSDEEVPGLYGGSSLVVTASTSEAGLNGMLLDGFWYERPVACTDLPQFTERIGADGDLARVFRAGDAADLARKIRSALDSPDATAAMVARAKGFISRRTWADAARDYLDVFEAVLKRGAGRLRGRALEGRGSEFSPGRLRHEVPETRR